jgi:hypothetical protein
MQGMALLDVPFATLFQGQLFRLRALLQYIQLIGALLAGGPLLKAMVAPVLSIAPLCAAGLACAV